jgi:hypothetical protein
MNSHQVESDTAGSFEIQVDDEGRITDVVGNWPGPGIEFHMDGPLPLHLAVGEVPDSVREKAGGRDVCFYDPDHCRTCFCDENGGMHCVGIC